MHSRFVNCSKLVEFSSPEQCLPIGIGCPSTLAPGPTPNKNAITYPNHNQLTNSLPRKSHNKENSQNIYLCVMPGA